MVCGYALGLIREIREADSFGIKQGQSRALFGVQVFYVYNPLTVLRTRTLDSGQLSLEGPHQ
jgi:hypothetical protein